MIDCHLHLCDSEFNADKEEVIERAKQAGIQACLVNTEGISEFSKVLSDAHKYPGFIIPCFGVHPVQYDITDDGPVPRSVAQKDLEGLEDWFDKHNTSLVAIGEVGLDYTPRYIHSDNDKPNQRAAFKFQIELSKKYDLPVYGIIHKLRDISKGLFIKNLVWGTGFDEHHRNEVICGNTPVCVTICHSRSSGKPVISFLRENGAEKVLLHAFDGNAKSAVSGIEAGYYFSVPPCVARSAQKQALVEKIPMEQILLETDSPVLGPEKQGRNEPMNCQISAEWIAKLKNIDVETVKKVTTDNALRLFPRLKSLLK